ncbi:MAG: RNA polymerase sigma factor [Candidatus Poribacteria bacterium]
MESAEIFERLYQTHIAQIYAFILRFMGNADDAEELAAETFLRAYQNISQLQDISKASAWLHKIAYNLCVDTIRKRDRIQYVYLDNGQAEEALSILETLKSDAPIPPVLAENQEIAAFMRGALSRLSPDYQAVLILRELEGKSDAEIADILERSEKAVKSLRQRARKALKKEVLKSLQRRNIDAEDFLS